MHDSCKYLNCASEEETRRGERGSERENEYAKRIKMKECDKYMMTRRKHTLFSVRNPLTWVSGCDECVTLDVCPEAWMCTELLSIVDWHVEINYSTLGFVCVENGERGKHTRARASLCEWLWCLFAFTSKLSRSLSSISGCEWWMPMIYNWAYPKRNIFLSRKKGKRKNVRQMVTVRLTVTTATTSLNIFHQIYFFRYFFPLFQYGKNSSNIFNRFW